MTSDPETLTAKKNMNMMFFTKKYIFAFHLNMYWILQICKIQIATCAL